MLSLIQVVKTIAIFHLIVATLHGIAHHMIPVPISTFQTLFVGVVIVVLPFVGMALIQHRDRGIGPFIFLGAMAGSLLFNHFYHFLQISADHVSQIPETPWGSVFQVTARLLEGVEIAGCIVAIGFLSPAFSTHKNS